jgi:dihydroflavonol-4-reductase
MGMMVDRHQKAAHSTPAGPESKRYLVTGGAGFIGSHLVRLLLDGGHSVRVVDLVPSPGLDRRAEFVQGSILDAPLMRAAMERVDQVFHLAANPRLWAPDKFSFVQTNLHGTRVVLDAAAWAGVQRIVHTSTELVFVGRRSKQDADGTDENTHRTFGDMLGSYSRSKYLAEQEVLNAVTRGLPVIIVNPTLPVGPGDYRLTPPTRMILDFVNGDNPAYMECAMNLIDVRDVAVGHILAADRGRIGERYILGGETVRMSRLLGMLTDFTGLAMPRIRVPYLLALGVAGVSEWIANHISRKSPKASLAGVQIAGASGVCNISKAVRELGLKPRPVREALQAEIGWLYDHGFIRRPLAQPMRQKLTSHSAHDYLIGSEIPQ